MLEGDPGLGKSSWTTAVAAAISSGRHLPWSTEAPKGRVLIASAEDDPARVIKPRLIANGANLSPHQVRFAKELFSLDEKGLQLLSREVEVFRPLLVVIDPIVAYLAGGVDPHSAADMTRFFKGLAAIARDFDCTILVVRHLRKSRQGDALMQGHGSVSIIGSIRSALVMASHPHDREVKAVAHTKSNYGQFGRTMLFSIEVKNGAPVIEWLGFDEELSADDLVRPHTNQGPGRPARSPRMSENSCSTILRRAKKKLKTYSFKRQPEASRTSRYDALQKPSASKSGGKAKKAIGSLLRETPFRKTERKERVN